MTERAIHSNHGAAKELAGTFEHAVLEECASPLKFLLSLYKGNFINLFVSFLFLPIKSAPVYAPRRV